MNRNEALLLYRCCPCIDRMRTKQPPPKNDGGKLMFPPVSFRDKILSFISLILAIFNGTESREKCGLRVPLPPNCICVVCMTCWLSILTKILISIITGRFLLSSVSPYRTTVRRNSRPQMPNGLTARRKYVIRKSLRRKPMQEKKQKNRFAKRENNLPPPPAS
jgi:hypothetical protein